MTVKIFTVSKIGTKMPDTYLQRCVHIYDLQIDILKEKKNRFTVMQRSTVVTVIRTGYVHLSILHTTQEKKQTDIFIYFLLHKHIRMDYSF